MLPTSSLPLLRRLTFRTHSYLTTKAFIPARTISKMAEKEYKLKLPAGLPAKNGDKTEAEIEGLDGAKVLLLRVNNTLRALGPRCTHYGKSPTPPHTTPGNRELM
jgi:hypothetical protein